MERLVQVWGRPETVFSGGKLPRKTGRQAVQASQRLIQCDLESVKQSVLITLKIAKKTFLLRYQIEMEMQVVLDGMTTSQVSPAFSSEDQMDVAIHSVSVEGAERHWDNSDIVVIACYRHVPIAQPEAIVPRQMTTDI